MVSPALWWDLGVGGTSRRGPHLEGLTGLLRRLTLASLTRRI